MNAWSWLTAYLRWRRDMALHWRRIAALLPIGGDMVEVGTWRGDSAARWLRRYPRMLTLVDSYAPAEDESWEGRSSQNDLNAAYATAIRRVSHGLAEGRVRFMRQRSPDAASSVPDASQDLIYLDGDHSLRAVRADLAAWWPKVKPGGVIVGDDCILGRWWGADVIDAFNGFNDPNLKAKRTHGRWFVLQKEPALNGAQHEVAAEVAYW